MSDDPLLSSLCGICRMREPKYKCPRCAARTCSLACVKKHKNWSSCNGERDATVYVPATQLRTDSGIDHDYNFLHKLERKVEQADKIFTEERGILPQRKPDARPNKRARVHKGQSRGKSTFGDDFRPWARAAITRLRKLNINVEHAPYGMSRAKENKTSYNQKQRVVNWQVEWLLLDSKDAPTRILGRALDTVPLYAAFGDCQWQKLSKGERELEKKAQKSKARDDESQAQDDEDSEDTTSLQHSKRGTWSAAQTFSQDTKSGQWKTPTNTKQASIKDQGLWHDKDKYRFFLGNPKDPSREAKKLVPMEATAALEVALRGSTVVEFPQIYVLPATLSLPPGYMINKPKKTLATDGKKRKADALVAYGSESDSDLDSASDAGPEVEPSSKEGGHAKGQMAGDDSDPGFEFENEEQRAEFLASYKAKGLQTAEDTTSSSGSDSSDASDMEVD